MEEPFHAASAEIVEEAVMDRITGDTKVAAVIEQCPDTIEVFLSRGCPDMRRGFFNMMARLMSVRNAARMHGLDLAPLLEDLNKAARNDQQGRSGK